MILTYHGHSMFKIKSARGTVVTDPFEDYVGFAPPRLSADIVTISHAHPDHNAIDKISGTARRSNPFIITEPGEYEVGRISVFGTKTYHDTSEGSERGENIVYTVLADNIRVCHLGDLGHELNSDQLDAIGHVDILLVPVGGTFTIDPEAAVKTIRALEPGIAIPMHFKTDRHNQDVFADLKPLETFLKEYGVEPVPQPKLDISRSQISGETELIILQET